MSTCSPIFGRAPDSAATIGYSTTGSAKAAMLGGMAMKWRWRERRKRRAAGKPTGKAAISSPARFRSAGTNSPATGISNCGRSPWKGSSAHDPAKR